MRLLLFLLLITISLPISAQIDFNDYRSLQSKGIIPADFSDLTYEKIEEGMLVTRSELGNQLDQREFLEKTGYAIDELLHSGLVVYGDEVSNYVSSIADKLLAGNPSLRGKLRFYTLKLNETNAFSTDQGIIFVTTGLIAQLTSEAQLAFILAHEISHYTEKHVVETFTWKKSNRYGNDWVGRMSVYSKDKEFDADKLAVDMYRVAGYAKEEMISTFDVLLYSYLPFDEVAIDLDYFSSDLLYLPPFLFPSKEYPIKADPDEDDSESSHPNINKRKEALQARIDEIGEEWGTTVNSKGDDVFLEMRNIARFESVRTDIIQAHFGDALYSIYLLEHDFPSSIFLKRMKAQTWVGLYQYELIGRTNNTIRTNKELEGESAPVHYMIRKLNKKSLTTLALRNVYDIHQTDGSDEQIDAIYRFMLRELSEDTGFNINDYSRMTFQQFGDSVEVNNARNVADTLKPETPKSIDAEPKKSKYQRIKETTSPDAVELEVDSLKYYVYGLSDLVGDSVFVSDLEKFKEDVDISPPPVAQMTRSGRKAYENLAYEELKIGSNNLIVVEPRVIDYGKLGIDLPGSEKLEDMFIDAIGYAADLAGTETHRIDKRNLTTSSYNERSILFGFLTQLVEEDNIIPFPIDYTGLKDISKRYGTSDVMFTVVDHTFRPEVSSLVMVTSMVVFPTLPFTLSIYLPLKVMAGNQTNLTVLLVDLNTGQLKAGNVFDFHERVSKHNIGSRMYSIFKHIASEQ